MALREALERLMEGIRRPQHNYVPTVDPFPELNAPKITAQFDPKGRGTLNGEKNIPPTKTDHLGDVEQEIVNYIELERTNCTMPRSSSAIILSVISR